MDILNLLQPHTVDIYHLQEKKYEVSTVPARSLLHLSRFDLYAKLYYIRYRKLNSILAKKVYLEHIKTFNPDGKEPGRDDKLGFNSFIISFDQLIDYFEKNEFDSNISVIPVSENGIILDGAHRIAALAFFDKDVKIVRFSNVLPKCLFNAEYFINRGLSWDIADIITLELLNWHNDIHVACLWPKMGNTKNKNKAIQIIKKRYPICYKKNLKVTFKSFIKIIIKVYKDQSWVGSENNNYAGATDKALNCYSKNGFISFVFFQADNLSEVLSLKQDIRNLYPLEKHSIHITDNIKETKDIAHFVLDKSTLDNWLYSSKEGTIIRLKETITERIYYFKKVQWINFKVALYSFLTLSFLKKK